MISRPKGLAWEEKTRKGFYMIRIELHGFGSATPSTAVRVGDLLRGISDVDLSRIRVVMCSDVVMDLNHPPNHAPYIRVVGELERDRDIATLIHQELHQEVNFIKADADLLFV